MTWTSALERLLQRWWVVAAALAIGLASGGLALLWLPRTYEARADVLVVASGDLADANALQNIMDSNVQTYLDLFDADASRAQINQLSGMQLSGSQIEEQVDIEPSEGSAVISITARADSPEDAAKLAEASATALGTVVHETDIGGPAMSTELVRAPVAPSSPASPDPVALLASSGAGMTVLGILLALALPERARQIENPRSTEQKGQVA